MHAGSAILEVIFPFFLFLNSLHWEYTMFQVHVDASAITSAHAI